MAHWDKLSTTLCIPGPSSCASWRPCTHFLPLIPPTPPLLLKVLTSVLKWKDTVPRQWIATFVLPTRPLLAEVNTVQWLLSQFPYFKMAKPVNCRINDLQHIYRLLTGEAISTRGRKREGGIEFLFTCVHWNCNVTFLSPLSHLCHWSNCAALLMSTTSCATPFSQHALRTPFSVHVERSATQSCQTAKKIFKSLVSAGLQSYNVTSETPNQTTCRAKSPILIA